MNDSKTPLQLPDGWQKVRRMSFTAADAPSAADAQRADIAFGVNTPEKLISAFQQRLARLK